MFFRGHYDNWRISRMNALKKYVKPEYFKSKTILEMGCGYGDNGNSFHELGAIVTCCDARTEHLEVVKERYPHLKTMVIDGDKDDIIDKYDVILHWGLLYHLKEIETHLEKISQKCDVLLLETEVADSDDIDFYISTDESGFDQAFNNKGITPSPGYVERILQKNGFEFKLIKDSILNCEFHRYDWPVTNQITLPGYALRRFWICWKNTNYPLVGI